MRCDGARWLIGVWLIVGLQAGSLEAQKVSIGANAGSGQVPLTDWADFFGGVQYSHYESDRLALYWELFSRLAIADHHIVKLSVERITTSSSLAAVSVFSPGPGSATSTTEWDFSTVPVSLTYEFHLLGFDATSTPYLGAGAAVYFSAVETVTRTLYSPDDRVDLLPDSATRDGEGYGFHGYVGQRTRITDKLSLSAQIRGRWADGMGFSEDPEDIDVDFTGIDLTVGLEWMFR